MPRSGAHHKQAPWASPTCRDASFEHSWLCGWAAPVADPPTHIHIRADHPTRTVATLCTFNAAGRATPRLLLPKPLLLLLLRGTALAPERKPVKARSDAGLGWGRGLLVREATRNVPCATIVCVWAAQPGTAAAAKGGGKLIWRCEMADATLPSRWCLLHAPGRNNQRFGMPGLLPP